MQPKLERVPPARSWIARRRFALVSGAVAFLVAIGGGGAWAFWTASVSASASLSTVSVRVTHANFPTLTATYLPSSLTSTGSFTVTNTGQIAGVATVQMAAPEAFATNLSIQVWTVTLASNCTAAATVPGSGVVSGTWGAPPALTPSLPAGQSVIYCVRTTIPNWRLLTSATGSRSAQPKISVSLNAGGWLATSTTATNTQQTTGMYPLASNYFVQNRSRWFKMRSKVNANFCLDSSQNGSNGSKLYSWACDTDSTQRWEFIPVSGSDQTLVTIRPRHAVGTRIGYDASNDEELQTASGITAQQWYVQQIPGTIPITYQFVNAANGRCLSLRGVQNASNMPTVPCTDPLAQIVLQRESLAFEQPTTTSLKFTFGGSNISEALTLQRWTGASWVAVGTAAAGSTSFQYTFTTTGSTSAGNYLAPGDNDFRFVNFDQVPIWDNIRLSSSGTTVTAVSGIG